MKTIVTLTFSLLISAPLAVYAADAKANWANNCAQCHGACRKGRYQNGKNVKCKGSNGSEEASLTSLTQKRRHGNQRRREAERQNDDEGLRRQVER